VYNEKRRAEWRASFVCSKGLFPIRSLLREEHLLRCDEIACLRFVDVYAAPELLLRAMELLSSSGDIPKYIKSF
jgi:hypothetical protein